MMLIDVPKRLPKTIGLAGASNTQVGAGSRSGRGRQGGTIIEVMVASVILAILGAGIVSSINCGMFMMRLARENARATQVLLEKSEALRMYNWYQVVYSNNFIPSSFTAAYDPQAGTNNQGAIYNGTIVITNVPFSATYNTNMRQCTISVQWTTAGRINHTRSLTTYIARDGVQNYVY